MSSTYSLLRAAKNGDGEACERLIIENAGLIRSILRRFIGCGVDAEDLYQLGCIGLLKAIQGFDESTGNQFSTYAVPKIAGEIRRFLRDDGTVKVSRKLKENSRKIRAARDMLTQQLGRDPVLSELSAATGFSVEEIAQSEYATGHAESLDRETSDDGPALESLLGNDGIEEVIIERVALSDAMENLPQRERMVLVLRFFKGLTQAKTASIMNTSQVQISRIERAALQRMRKFI